MLPTASNIGLLADDLTGACDLAACFARVNGPVAVAVDPNRSGQAGTGLRVINTQSRLLAAQASRSLLYTVGTTLAQKPLIFKKIDTALRGAVGAELEGLVEALGPRQVIVAPASPRIGRTTQGGLQYDNGRPIHQSPFAHDRASPVDSSDIAHIIRRTGRVECRILDAQTDAELVKIVEQALDGSKTVFVGSIGLADALAARMTKIASLPADMKISSRPVILCGSRYETTQRQIQYAVQHLNVNLIEMSSDDEMTSSVCDLNLDLPLIVRMAGPRNPAIPHAPSRLSSKFIEKVIRLLEACQPDGLGIIGGQTAYEFVRQMQIGRLVIHGRLSDVIPYGSIGDGAWAGYPVVTKGGSVGSADAVVRMIAFLTGPKEGTH